jgi:hypothetical protein
LENREIQELVQQLGEATAATHGFGVFADYSQTSNALRGRIAVTDKVLKAAVNITSLMDAAGYEPEQTKAILDAVQHKFEQLQVRRH